MQLNQIDSYLAQFESQKQRIQDAKKICDSLLNEELDTSFNDYNSSAEDDECVNDLMSNLAMDLNCTYSGETNKLKDDINKLNTDQNNVFAEVIETVQHQESHKLNKCSCLKKPETLRLFTSGVGGNLFLID